MLCLEIHHQNELLCRAGIQRASMLSAHVSAFVGDDEALGYLHLSGMCELGGERIAHVYWNEPVPLAIGDWVAFRLVESDEPFTPTQIKPTESAEYIEEQRKFEEFERQFVPPTEPSERRWPNTAMTMFVNGEEQSRARFVGKEEHILCSIDWNQWRPDYLKVFARSFGEKPSDEKQKKEWLRKNLVPGDCFEIEIGTV
jgi:hypothetical protein